MTNRWLTAMVAMVVAACGDMEHAPTSYTPAANRMATAGDDADPPVMPVTGGGPESPGLAAPPIAPPPGYPPAGAVRMVVLRPLGSGSLGGSVALMPQGASSVASTTLSGGASGTSYRGAVREGSCELLAAKVASLLDVTVDTAGTGRSATILAIPADSLAGVPHAIVYGNGGRPETCGEIGGGSAPAADTTGLAVADALLAEGG